jgi:hypothetical protein
MSREETIINRLVADGLVGEIKDALNNSNANDLITAQFIYDVVKNVEASVILNDLVEFYGEAD